MISVSIEHRIPFHDVDVMQIAWHGHYYKYFELARTELMKSINLDWPELCELGISMPVVESQANYRSSIKYDQLVRISATIEDWQFPELRIKYAIFSSQNNSRLATGNTRQIYWDINKETTLFGVPKTVLGRLQNGKNLC